MACKANPQGMCVALLSADVRLADLTETKWCNAGWLHCKWFKCKTLLKMVLF